MTSPITTVLPPTAGDIIQAYPLAHQKLDNWLEAQYQQGGKHGKAQAKVTFIVLDLSHAQFNALRATTTAFLFKGDEEKIKINALYHLMMEADKTLKLHDKAYLGLAIRKWATPVSVIPHFQVAGYRMFTPKDALWAEVTARVGATKR